MTVVNNESNRVHKHDISTLNMDTVGTAQEVRICFTITGNDARDLVVMLKKEGREPEELISEMIIEGLERRGLVEYGPEDSRLNRTVYILKKTASAFVSAIRWIVKKVTKLVFRRQRAQS